MLRIQFKRLPFKAVTTLWLVIVVIAFYSLPPVLHATEYAEIGVPVTRVFKNEEHLGGAQLWTIVQAKNGLIYSGGNSGIIEWDGERWRKYRTPGNTRVRSISIANDGRLYVGTFNDIGFYASNDIGILEFH